MHKAFPVALAGLALLAFCSSSSAQVSEKEVQGLESQEFGIEDGKKTKTSPEEAPPAGQPEDYQPEAEPEKVKPIEAEEFRVRIKRTSTSKRVLLLDDASENRPRPGKILLLKDGGNDVAAVRVLKNYPGKFAAKIVLRFIDPQAETEYRALKKLGDKMIALIKEREARGKDLDAAKTDEELAREVAPDDNELDRGIPIPKPKSKKDGSQYQHKAPEPLFNKEGNELGAEGIEIADEDEPYADLSVQEDLPLEPYRHALSLQIGSLRNVDKNNDPATYNGYGFRYAFNAWRMPMWRRKNFQDMFSLELSLFFYSIDAFIASSDSVSVYPLIGTVRYSLLIGENLALFFYAGFIKNNVSTDEGALSSNTQVLATTKAAVGAGAMLKIGPAWAVRLDVGTDLFAVGAVLKF